MPIVSKLDTTSELARHAGSSEAVRATILQEIGEDLRQREERIHVLEQRLEAEASAHQQVTIERVKLAEDLALEKVKRKAVQAYLARREKRAQPYLVKVLPAAMGMVGSGLTLLGERFDRIPYANHVALGALILVPGLLAFAGFGWLRTYFTKRMAQQHAEKLARVR